MLSSLVELICMRLVSGMQGLEDLFATEPFVGRCEIPCQYAEDSDAAENNACLEITLNVK